MLLLTRKFTLTVTKVAGIPGVLRRAHLAVGTVHKERETGAGAITVVTHRVVPIAVTICTK